MLINEELRKIVVDEFGFLMSDYGFAVDTAGALDVRLKNSSAVVSVSVLPREEYVAWYVHKPGDEADPGRRYDIETIVRCMTEGRVKVDDSRFGRRVNVRKHLRVIAQYSKEYAGPLFEGSPEAFEKVRTCFEEANRSYTERMSGATSPAPELDEGPGRAPGGSWRSRLRSFLFRKSQA